VSSSAHHSAAPLAGFLCLPEAGFGSRLTDSRQVGLTLSLPVVGHPAIGPAVCTTFRWPGYVQGAGANWTKTGMFRPVAHVLCGVVVPVHFLPAYLAGEDLRKLLPDERLRTTVVELRRGKETVGDGELRLPVLGLVAESGPDGSEPGVPYRAPKGTPTH